LKHQRKKIVFFSDDFSRFRENLYRTYAVAASESF